MPGGPDLPSVIYSRVLVRVKTRQNEVALLASAFILKVQFVKVGLIYDLFFFY